MLCGNRLAHGLKHFLKVAAIIPVYFTDDDCSFLPIMDNRKCGCAIGPDRGMRALNGLFNILWVVVSSADDDAVLQPARYVEFAMVKKSKIAGAQIWPFSGVEEGMKDLLRSGRILPITCGNTGTG